MRVAFVVRPDECRPGAWKVSIEGPNFSACPLRGVSHAEAREALPMLRYAFGFGADCQRCAAAALSIQTEEFDGRDYPP